MTDNWTATLTGCEPDSLNGLYVYRNSEGNSIHYYSRTASNTAIPAEFKITNTAGVNNRVDITITVKPGEWLLYDKETGQTASNGKSKVTFTDGTVFEIKNPTTTTTTLDVSNCPRGLNGTYTKTTNEPKYTKAGTTSSLDSYVTCDFSKKLFAIGVKNHEIQCGQRKYTGNNDGPESIGEPTTSNANSVQKKMVMKFTKKTDNSWCTFHPYSHLLVNSSGNPILDGTKRPTIWCYIGSNDASASSSTSIECEQTGKWVTKSGGSEIVRCTPGLRQQYINISGFSGAEAIFNGSYKQNEKTAVSEFAWVSTSNGSLKIVVSGEKEHTLELKRDASLSVSYKIAISNYTGTNDLPTLTVVSADTKRSGPIGIRVVFSGAESGQRECALWTECASDYDALANNPLLQNAESCAAHAVQCAPPTTSTTSGTSALSLKTSADATAVPLYTLVSGAAHLYGRDASGGLYIVFPNTRDTKKAQVLLIQGNNKREVKSAALGTDGKLWTITVADKPNETDGTNGTDKPNGTDGTNGTDKPNGANGPSGTGKPDGPSGTGKPDGPSDTKAGVPSPSQSPCGDLVACAVTHDLDSCAVAAVACTVTPGTATHTLDHGEKKGIKLFPLSPGVLYGTDAEAAYVIVTTSGKSKLLVAPLDKTTATVLDVDLKGTVWTSKSDNTMTWIIIGSVVGGVVVLLIIAVLFFVFTREPQREELWSRYRPALSRAYRRLPDIVDVGPAAAATSTTTTSPATSMSPAPPR